MRRARTKRHSSTPVLPTPTMKFRRAQLAFSPSLSKDETDEICAELSRRGGSMYGTGSGGLSLEIYRTVEGPLVLNIQYEARPLGRAKTGSDKDHAVSSRKGLR